MNPADNLASFLAHAVVLEDEAASCYDQLAEAMQTHGNREVAELFETMAGYSRLHRAEAIRLARKHAGGLPALKPWELHFPDDDSPENADLAHCHYLMTPFQALSLALAAERSAHRFYAAIAAASDSVAIIERANEFAAEEAEHVSALQRWLKAYPKPEPAWDEDLDPPSQID